MNEFVSNKQHYCLKRNAAEHYQRKCDKQVASLNCSAPISRVETGCLNLLFRQQ